MPFVWGGVDQMRKGADFSLWDTKMDWSKYTWPFAFIKASEGTVIDPQFYTHWADAKGKTQRGPYHFFRAFVDPKEAVNKLLSYLDDDLGELPAVLDLEVRDNVDKRTAVSRALTWLIEYERRTSIKPIVYISQGFINDLELYKYPDFADYVLWLAQYPFDLIYPGYTEADRTAKIKRVLDDPALLRIPLTPKPFKVMKYIQWTAKGNPFDVPGYYTGIGHKKAVDFNFQLETVSEPGEPMPETIKEGTVSRAKLGTATTLQIRAGAGQSFADIGDLHAGDRVYGRIVSAVWLEFEKIIRVDNRIEMMHGFASTQFMDVRDVPLSEPTPDPTPTRQTFQVTVSSEGYETVIVELRPR